MRTRCPSPAKQTDTVVAWKKAVSALYTTAAQLAADKAQLVVLNNTLRSEKCVLESKVEELAAERDRLVSTLQKLSLIHI